MTASNENKAVQYRVTSLGRGQGHSIDFPDREYALIFASIILAKGRPYKMEVIGAVQDRGGCNGS